MNNYVSYDLDDRIMRNGMLWMNHSGAQWRQIPKRYGPWQSVYARFAKRRDDGVWEKIFTELSKDADTENLRIDSTCVKVHAIVYGLGNPVAFLLSPGNDSDSVHAVEWMNMTDIAGSNLLGDKAYGTKEIPAYSREHGAAVVIPPKSSAKEPWEADDCLYKERHLVECLFQKIKWFFKKIFYQP